MAQKQLRIGINGFGRIGRRVFRLMADDSRFKVVAINDVVSAATLIHLLKYDSIHGIFQEDFEATETGFQWSGGAVRVTQIPTPGQIPWSEEQVDVVVECSGKFKNRTSLQGHLQQGVQRVILSVPPDDDSIPTVVMGVNDDQLQEEALIISNASCTTNNAAPMIQVVRELCGVEAAYITTVHSYTTDQSLHDQPHRDLRRARAAGQSIVPTTTGAAKALTKIFPDLASTIGGCGIRVPVPNGSLTDMTLMVKENTTIEAVNAAFAKAAEGSSKGLLEYTEVPLVSVDIIGNTHSCVFDAQMTSVIGKMVKLIGWYDNETGYAMRIIDLISRVSLE
ncbi:type I glyceraldehyde-3-phosphate dehydrogenase [Croceiramulus getboli]|nr:type I glyceraldehyde-3-phosphate dehydrogenase [Flavobacteriaceae bacterium YJPT1-3]